jgi:hypothetical protein
MKRNNKIRALLFAACLVLCGGFVVSPASPANAQSGLSTSSPSQNTVKTQFAVQRMLNQSLQVRDLTVVPGLHTFTYSPAIRDKMQKVFDAGGYQYGDLVVIWYKSGTTVALNIKGKPSKKK